MFRRPLMTRGTGGWFTNTTVGAATTSNNPCPSPAVPPLVFADQTLPLRRAQPEGHFGQLVVGRVDDGRAT